MAGFMTIADARIRLDVLQVPVTATDLKALTVTDMADATKASCHIMKEAYQLGATGQATIPGNLMCKPGEGQAPGAITWAGNLVIPRFLDDDGLPDATADEIYSLFKTPGTKLVLVEREGPAEDAEWAEGQEYSVYEVETLQPLPPSDRFAGYIRRTVPLAVSTGHTDCVIAAA